MKINIGKAKTLGTIATIVSLASTVLSMVVQKNEQEVLKAELKEEILKELVK